MVDDFHQVPNDLKEPEEEKLAPPEKISTHKFE